MTKPPLSLGSAKQVIGRLYPRSITDPIARVSSEELAHEFKAGEYSPVYGEITCDGTHMLLEHALAKVGTPLPAVVDFGSGVGKFCIQAALTHGNRVGPITGIELSISRHAIASSVLTDLQKESLIEPSKVTFINSNILQWEYSQSVPVIVYMASLTFSTPFMNAIRTRFVEQLPKRSLIYTMRAWDDKRDRLVPQNHTLDVPTTWSTKTPLHVYVVE
jgi:hypothetical protein